MEERKGEHRWDTGHHDGDWHQVLVPKLELLMTAWDEVYSGEVHYYHQFN